MRLAEEPDAKRLLRPQPLRDVINRVGRQLEVAGLAVLQGRQATQRRDRRATGLHVARLWAVHDLVGALAHEVLRTDERTGTLLQVLVLDERRVLADVLRQGVAPLGRVERAVREFAGLAGTGRRVTGAGRWIVI